METFDSYDTFGLYILTPVWCVCLTVIIGFYGRIFLLVRAHGRKIFDKGSFPPPDKKKEDKKQKQEETKTNIKSDTENPQTMDTDTLKPNEKEQSRENPLDLHPTSEELPITTVTDYLDINEPEIVTEKSREVAFKDELPNEIPQVLEGIVESADHHTSPSANEEVGVVTVGEVSGVTNGEGGKEDPIDHRDTTSETSPSTNEVGAVESSSHQVTDGEFSGGSNSGEDGEEDHRDSTSETSPSASEDGTVESSAPQDTTKSTGEEGAEEQSSPQETAAESSPASTGETTAAPQEEEEEVAGAVCMMPSLAQRERGNAKKESKLAKRSGYIIFTFLIFWIPLIATVVLNHFYYRDGNITVSFGIKLPPNLSHNLTYSSLLLQEKTALNASFKN